jgi:prepilin-type N-terminal cleavage/methylation domain-containing protein
MTHTRRPQHHARGFTLVEVTLALVLSGLVLAGCLSVFIALRNAERTFSTRFERTSELDITRTSLSRAMLSLQMKEAETTTVVRAGSEEEAEENEESERPRLLLHTDLTVDPDTSGWQPQRLEVVCATPPVPAGLASQAAEWYTAQSREESLDFSALDGSQGITRGVFELRPKGEREIIMQRLGLSNPSSQFISDEQIQLAQQAPPAQDEIPSWTLWWRPILTYEAEQLNAGFGPLPDTVGTEEEIRERLAGAIPLLREIERCVWELYKEDQFITEHEGLEMDDLPAYAQFEVILTNQQYASWMFEVDWVIGDDPVDIASAGSAGSGDTNDGSGEPPTNNGNNTGGPGNGGQRPGGNQGPGGNRFDFSGDS